MLYELSVAFAAGMLLGIFYFGILWLTVRAVRNLRRSRLPLVYASFVVRLAVVFVAMYIIMDGRMERLIAALFGLLLVRPFMMERVRSTLNSQRGE